MVCAETSFIIALERRENGAIEKMRELEESGETVYITAITVAEIYHGAYTSKDRTRALKDSEELLNRFVVLNLDYESGRIWGQLATSMKSNTIGDRDLFIASIAIANRQTLITKNKKHFERVTNLDVEGW
ncbi:MAG: type II toxin-antitoxin system VapC family toxin [Thaumarchaeota archaeon]|nr:type II toxin-antitoxin system VapC family toxin [Nitrososphaerota archaeon]MDE1831925.1 type II toxin-antitoxin system VapC family toxin [Nitrososphaerota archaeon]MDE1841628.1 type II toxin-antitoxin system VapC family toxin [Nitrososphaerota archaeon]